MAIKKIATCSIAAAFVLWAAGCAGSVKKTDKTAGFNGSFEITKSGWPANWSIYKPSIKSGDAELVLDTTDAKDGKQSLKFVIHKCPECSESGGWHCPGIFQEKPAISEKSYKVSFWLKNQGCKFRVRLISIIEKRNRSDEKTVLETDETFDAWRRYEYMYTICKDGTSFRFELNILSPGTLWIDDIKVEEVQKNTDVSSE